LEEWKGQLGLLTGLNPTIQGAVMDLAELLKTWMPKRASFLEGYIFKEMVRSILEEGGYGVIPFGWETFLSYIKRDLYEKYTLSPTGKRIRYAPDLLVLADDALHLVEVKARNWDGELLLKEKERYLFDAYKQYWPDSILVLIVPYRHWFYAKRVSDIELKEYTVDNEKQLYLDPQDLNLFEEVFQHVNTDILYGYKRLAGYFFGIFGTERYNPNFFPELKFPGFGWNYNVDLLNFIRKNPNLQEEELFKAYNRINLVSKEIFNENMKELREQGCL
jgi:hypothetical protein